MRALYVFYDDACGFCCRVAEWLRTQPTFLPVGVLPSRELPDLKSGRMPELVVIDSEGGVYRDADAWLMTLWALREWRGWAQRLARGDRRLARKVVELAGSWRHGLSQLFKLTSEAELTRQLEVLPASPRCEEGQCETPACKSCGVPTRPGHPFCPRCLPEAQKT
jgi:hypothetical protein